MEVLLYYFLVLINKATLSDISNHRRRVINYFTKS